MGDRPINPKTGQPEERRTGNDISSLASGVERFVDEAKAIKEGVSVVRAQNNFLLIGIFVLVIITLLASYSAIQGRSVGRSNNNILRIVEDAVDPESELGKQNACRTQQAIMQIVNDNRQLHGKPTVPLPECK